MRRENTFLSSAGKRNDAVIDETETEDELLPWFTPHPSPIVNNPRIKKCTHS